MNRTKEFFFAIMLLVLITISACQAKTPSLTEFQPEENSLLKISFSYPSNWNWERNPNSNKISEGIKALDPYPTNNLELIDGLRLIYIDVNIVPAPKTRMQERIEGFLNDVENLERFELLDDSAIQINSQNARKLIVRNYYGYPLRTDPFICEYIYVLGEDRYYQFSIWIPEDERDGQFHNEFRSMIESIKILP